MHLSGVHNAGRFWGHHVAHYFGHRRHHHHGGATFFFPYYYTPYLYSSLYPYSYSYPNGDYVYAYDSGSYGDDVCDPQSQNYDPEYCDRISSQRYQNYERPGYLTRTRRDETRRYADGRPESAAHADPFLVEIQQRLSNLGHYMHGHYQADGIYGPETIAAIRSFQRSKGLPETGVIDQPFLSALGVRAPSQAEPNPAAPVQDSTSRPKDPAYSVPPGYKLVPIDDPPKPIEQFVVPEGYILVPIKPAPNTESQPVAVKDNGL